MSTRFCQKDPQGRCHYNQCPADHDMRILKTAECALGLEIEHIPTHLRNCGEYQAARYIEKLEKENARLREVLAEKEAQMEKAIEEEHKNAREFWFSR